MGVLFFQKVWVKMFWLGMKGGLLSKKLDWEGGKFGKSGRGVISEIVLYFRLHSRSICPCLKNGCCRYSNSFDLDLTVIWQFSGIFYSHAKATKSAAVVSYV